MSAALVLTVVCLLALAVTTEVRRAPPAEASHFRAAQLTWTRSGPTTAQFKSTVSARRSFYGAPAVGATVSDLTFDFGDATFATPPHTVVLVDVANDYLIAEATFSHTFPSAGPFTVRGDSCCRLSGPLHKNNPDGDIRAQTLVDLAATTTSPVSSISPIVDCAAGQVCQFVVPAFDPDGQSLRWRFATGTEAAKSVFVQPGPPQAPNAAAIDGSTGRFTWNTAGAVLNPTGPSFYSTQVVVENLVGTTVVASTPVDFFVRLGAASSGTTSLSSSPRRRRRTGR
ncbi:MAG: hypothetical protein ACRD1K_03585 [Acidimicrobiales bacterium]